MVNTHKIFIVGDVCLQKKNPLLFSLLAVFLIILSCNLPIFEDTYFTTGITDKNQYTALSIGKTANFTFNNLDTWNLEMVNAFEAQQITNGSKDVIIAIVDTGLDFSYPDFNDHLWINEDELVNNGIDDDNNGYIDDYNGYDFHYDDCDPNDERGHGTFITSLILGLTDETSPETSVPGIAPNISLMILKYFGAEDAQTYQSHFIQSILYAVNNGADIISLSIWSETSSSDVLDTLDWAYEQGVLIVGITGNFAEKYQGIVGYFGKHSSVIATGAVDINANKASFSQYGPEIEMVAPGYEVCGSFLLNDSTVSILTVNSQEIQSNTFVDTLLGNVTSELVYANLGYINDYDELDATDKIILVDRGEFTFREKMINAYSKGASGIIIANNLEGNFYGTFNGTSFIPGTSISMEDGEKIKLWLTQGTITANLQINPSNVTKSSGTSFACPLVSATAALMFSQDPGLNNTQARSILKQTATDINQTGWDKYTGYGLLNAELAVKAVMDKEKPNVIVDFSSLTEEVEVNINASDNLGIYSIEISIIFEKSSKQTDARIYQGGIDNVQIVSYFSNKNNERVNIEIVVKDLAGNTYYFKDESFKPSNSINSFDILTISTSFLVIFVLKKKKPK